MYHTRKRKQRNKRPRIIHFCVKAKGAGVILCPTHYDVSVFIIK